MDLLTLSIPQEYPMTDDELFAFCVANKELRIERSELGQLMIMSPTGSLSGNRNFKIISLFAQWVDEHPALGYAFDSSAGFTLPDRSMRSPDVSWIKKDRWEALSLEQQKQFAPICPDFVIELKSDSDSIKVLKEKMLQWIKNGCELAWLIDPENQKAFVYKQSGSVEEFDFTQKLSGHTTLPDFILDLSKLR